MTLPARPSTAPARRQVQVQRPSTAPAARREVQVAQDLELQRLYADTALLVLRKHYYRCMRDIGLQTRSRTLIKRFQTGIIHHTHAAASCSCPCVQRYDQLAVVMPLPPRHQVPMVPLPPQGARTATFRGRSSCTRTPRPRTWTVSAGSFRCTPGCGGRLYPF